MSVSLYDGSVTVEFNAGNHRYKVNGEYKPGVTGILNVINKPLLMDWSASMAAKAASQLMARAQAEGKPLTDKLLRSIEKEAHKNYRAFSDTAKDFGHVVHGMVETYLTINKDAVKQPVSSEAVQAYYSFVKWWDDAGLTLEGSEQIIYSREYDYCGTYDMKVREDGKKLLGDLKTTKRGYLNQQGIYAEYVAQLGGYAIADEEETGEEVSDLFIVNPDKVYGELQFVKLSDYGISVQQAKDAFIAAYTLYKTFQPLDWDLKKQNTLKKGAWYAKAKMGEENE